MADHIVAAQIKTAKTLYFLGKSILEIAAATGIERHRLARFLKIAGIPLRNGSGKFTRAEEIAITARYAAGEHPKTVAADYAIVPRTVQDIARRHGIRIRSIWETRERHSLRKDAFSVLTAESAYWIGFLMADGWVKPHIGEVGLTLKTGDAVHIEAFRDFLGYGGKITTRPPQKSPSSANMTMGAEMISVRSPTLCADLAKYGVIARKSLIARAADILVFNRDFWRGVIDGDGSLGWHDPRTKKYPYLSLVGARPLVEQFRQFVLRNTTTRATVCPAKSVWCFRLAGVPAADIIKLLYHNANIALHRKAQMAEILLSNHYNNLEFSHNRYSLYQPQADP